MGLMDFCREQMTKHREIIMYGIFGVLTTIVTWVTYALFVWMGIEINLSNALSWVCGVTFAFVTNKWFVFMSKNTSAKVVLYEAVSFFSSRIATGVFAIVMFYVLYNIGLNQSMLGTDGLPAKIVTSILEIILNWVFSKYIVFRKGKKKEESDTAEREL